MSFSFQQKSFFNNFTSWYFTNIYSLNFTFVVSANVVCAMRSHDENTPNLSGALTQNKNFFRKNILFLNAIRRIGPIKPQNRLGKLACGLKCTLTYVLPASMLC